MPKLITIWGLFLSLSSMAAFVPTQVLLQRQSKIREVKQFKRPPCSLKESAANRSILYIENMDRTVNASTLTSFLKYHQVDVGEVVSVNSYTKKDGDAATAALVRLTKEGEETTDRVVRKLNGLSIYQGCNLLSVRRARETDINLFVLGEAAANCSTAETFVSHCVFSKNPSLEERLGEIDINRLNRASLTEGTTTMSGIHIQLSTLSASCKVKSNTTCEIRPITIESSDASSSGFNANVYWKSIPVDDLRTHPLYDALPSPKTVFARSPKDFSQFRQDTWQWDALHAGRLTTSKAAACLGFYEDEVGRLLNIPQSLSGHTRVLSAWQSLINFTPVDLAILNREFVSSDKLRTEARQKHDISTAREVWKSSKQYAFDYYPLTRPSNDHRNRCFSTVPAARLGWGTAQESTAVLAAVNYFSSCDPPAKVSEVGLLPLEAVEGIPEEIAAWIREGSLPLIGA